MPIIITPDINVLPILHTTMHSFTNTVKEHLKLKPNIHRQIFWFYLIFQLDNHFDNKTTPILRTIFLRFRGGPFFFVCFGTIKQTVLLLRNYKHIHKSNKDKNLMALLRRFCPTTSFQQMCSRGVTHYNVVINLCRLANCERPPG